MSPDKIEKIMTLGYWIDIGAKSVIAIFLSIGGYHVKKVSDDVEYLKLQNSDKNARLLVAEAGMSSMQKWMERVENKLDRALQGGH